MIAMGTPYTFLIVGMFNLRIIMRNREAAPLACLVMGKGGLVTIHIIWVFQIIAELLHSQRTPLMQMVVPCMPDVLILNIMKALLFLLVTRLKNMEEQCISMVRGVTATTIDLYCF